MFVALLDGRMVNHTTYGNDAYFPDIPFILDRIQTINKESIFICDMSSIEQAEVDEDLAKIIQKLPDTVEGK